MKGLHGFVREIAIEEQIRKMELLDKVSTEWGFEDVGTIEMHIMVKSCTYNDMLAYYHLRNAALVEDFGF